VLRTEYVQHVEIAYYGALRHHDKAFSDTGSVSGKAATRSQICVSSTLFLLVGE
jgi:hypothetical protein